MNLPVYKIYVDWDCADWAGVHDFSQSYDDITGDVKHLSISRGKDRDANTYPAATMEMVLNNFAGRYYPTTITGDLVGKIRLRLPVMAQAGAKAGAPSISQIKAERTRGMPGENSI